MSPSTHERYKEYGRNLALEGESSPLAMALLRAVEEDLRPRTFLERAFAEDIATNLWRKTRVRSLENAVVDCRFQQDPEITDLGPSSTSAYAAVFRHLSDESGILELLHRLDRDYSSENAATLRLFLQFRVARHSAINASAEYQGVSTGHRFLFDPPGDPDTIDWDLYKTPEPEQNEPE